MSGKAKVVVVREQDRKRLGRLLLALAVTVIGAISWELWLAEEQRELEERMATTLPIADRMQVSEPAYVPEFVPSEGNSSVPASRSRTLLQEEISKLVTRSRPKRPAPLEEVVTSPPTQPTVIANGLGSAKTPVVGNPQVLKPVSAPPLTAPSTATAPAATRAMPLPAVKPTSDAPSVAREMQSAVTPSPAPSRIVEPQVVPGNTGVASTATIENNQVVEPQNLSAQ